MTMRRFRYEIETLGCWTSITSAAVHMDNTEFVARAQGNQYDQQIIKQAIDTATRELVLAKDSPNYMRGWSAAGRC